MLFLAVLFTLVDDEGSNSLPRESYALACEDFLRIHQDEMQTRNRNNPPEEKAEVVPLACAILANKNGTLLMRVSFQIHLAESSLPTLLTLIHHRIKYCLCHRRYTLTGCDLTNRHWAGVATWSDLQRDACASPAPTSFSLRFVTPLVTTSREAKGCCASPFPEPLPFFSCLQERWQALSGPPIHPPVAVAIEVTRCVVASYHLRAKSLQTSIEQGLPLLGYDGTISYLCQRVESEALALLQRLVRLAFFTGCGYHTLTGQGMTKIDLSCK